MLDPSARAHTLHVGLKKMNREKLISVIRSQPEAETGGAVVTVNEFFGGNEDIGSIGCNLANHPGLDFFRLRLKEIEAREDVESVWLQIYDWDEGDWPFSENVLIKGSIQKEALDPLIEPLLPSEFEKEVLKDAPTRAPEFEGDIYRLWWD